MEDIQRVRDDFSSVKETQKSVEEIFVSLSKMIESLQALYMDYVQRSEDRAESFGVDSLKFQRRYISEERDGMKNLFAMINNQMYKDHYNLYKHIVSYVDVNIKDQQVREACYPEKDYEAYSDDEPCKEYCFEEVFRLHHDITSIVAEMLDLVNEKEDEVKLDQGNVMAGINIDVFVATEEFNNMAIGNKARLFLEYLKTFNKYHLSYLSRFSSSLNLSHSQIMNELNIEELSEEQDDDESAKVHILETISEVASPINCESEESLEESKEDVAEEPKEEEPVEEAVKEKKQEEESKEEESKEEEAVEEKKEEESKEEEAKEEEEEKPTEEPKEEEAKEEEEEKPAEEPKEEVSEESAEEAKEEVAEDVAKEEVAAEEPKEEVVEESAEQAKEDVVEEVAAEEPKEEVVEESAEQAEKVEEPVSDAASDDTGVIESVASCETDSTHFSNDSSQVVLEVEAVKEEPAMKDGLTEQQLKWQLKNRERLAKRRQNAGL